MIQLNYILFKIKLIYRIIYILTAATKLLFQEFVSVIQCQIIHTCEQQTESIFCDCPLTLDHIFLECSDTLPARNLLSNVRLHVCKTFLHRLIAVMFCKNVILVTKFKDFYNFTFFIYVLYFYICRMGR